ncbi:2-oxoacid:acceptor oxidoreductase family protein [Bacilliculturomica massiliensis]|uniref:2-oxoacid:acceptor oxidoreductase family protein n=1 Tax=Bacilliculturomica massiliensis TaxID=1917867 RepID=UPI001031CB78|nr:2-oxoacid:acceptor oxidoreductase family protein [Bacilliculturomica massiliensis]
MSTRKLILAGFGGQGVLLIGQIISYAAMYEEKHVTFLPSYGPEMRGGTANCTVIVSDDPIACPLADSVTDLMAMNLPSLLKFESAVVAGGNIFLNSSLIRESPRRSDVNVIPVDAAGLAEKIGNEKSSNIVMLGAIINKTAVVRYETVEKVLAEKIFTGAKAGLLAKNKPALTAWTE